MPSISLSGEVPRCAAFLCMRLTYSLCNILLLKASYVIEKYALSVRFLSLAAIQDDEERVLVATGRYLGEGFDDARLDALFLTMPISWRGTLAQYAGRLHRLHAAKRDVVIYDYVDANEPMLARMAAKREAGYRSLGYRAASGAELDLDSSPCEPAP